VATWASVSDLAMLAPNMRLISALPAECQIRVLRALWFSMRWVPAGTILLTPSDASDRMIVVVRGEGELLLGHTDIIPLLPAGSFVCEAALLTQRCPAGDQCLQQKSAAQPLWAFRGWQRIPSNLLGIVGTFLGTSSNVPRLHGKVRTTKRSLIAQLSRERFQSILSEAEAVNAREFAEMPVCRNALQNVTSLRARRQNLGAEDVATLNIVCEGPLHATCQRGFDRSHMAGLKAAISCWPTS